MQSRLLARIALFFGGFAAVLSWWSFAATQTVFDTEATRSMATSLFAAQPIQDSAIQSLTDQLDGVLPAGSTARTTEVRRAAATALSDPRVVAAFGDAIASLHEQLLDDGGSHNDLVVDTNAVTAAVRDRLATIDPTLAESITDNSLAIKLDTADLPNLNGPKSLAPKAAGYGALIALAVWAIAILLHPQPFVAVRSIGRRLIGIGLVPVLFWVVVPWLLRKFEADAAQTFAPLASGYGQRLAGPALIVALVGAIVWVAGRFSGPALRAAETMGGAAKRGASALTDAQRVHSNGRSVRRRAARHSRASGSRDVAERIDVKL